MSQPINNGDEAIKAIGELVNVLQKPLLPAAILLNEMSPNEQAVIVWFIHRCKERQEENRARIPQEILDILDKL
jgi:hypothetical protein